MVFNFYINGSFIEQGNILIFLCISNKLYLFQISNMSNFFTPVQVPSAQQGLAEQYQIDKYKTDPFMPTPIKIESFGDHRRKIMQWLKSMPVAIRIDKLMFTNKQFACLLISMFEKIEDRSGDYLRQFGISYCQKQGFKIVEERFNRKPNIALIEAQQRLMKSILIANRYSRFDSVTIDSSLASDINYLFQLFDIIQNGVSYQLTPNNYQNYTNQENSQLMFYNPSDHDGYVTKSLGTWFVEVIKKKVSLQYYKECIESKNQQFSFNHRKIDGFECFRHINGKKYEMTEIFKSKSKLFKRYWKLMSHIQRQIFIEKVINNDIRQILGEYRQIIKVANESFPNIKYSHPYNIKKFIETLTQNDGQFLLNELVFTKLEDSSFEIATYKYQIMVQVQNQIQRKKKEDSHIFLRKKRKQIKTKKSQIKCSNIHKQQVTKNDKLFLQEQTLSKSNKTKQKDQLKCSAPTQSIKQKNENQELMKTRKKKKNVITQCSAINNQFSGCRQQSETTNDQDDDAQQLSSYSTVNEGKKSKKQSAEEEFNKVLSQFSQRIGSWNKYQQIALNRVGCLLSTYNLSYQVFGSFANGLATSSSDIDISVDPTIIHFFYGTFCSYRQKIILALQFLQNCFEQMNWAGNFNLISTASVPVLVFEIDLSIAFGDSKNLDYNVQKHKKGPKICVDLTIEPFANMMKQCTPHLGFESTNLVKQWISQFSRLKQLTCFFKHILCKQKLNKSFSGGLSSYALTTILYSFLKADKTRAEKSKIDLISQFCQFIGNFNQNLMVIQVQNIEPIQNKNSDKFTVLNYLNGKNLTQNCFRFIDIKNLMLKVKQVVNLFETDNQSKQYGKSLRNLILQ